LCKVINGSFVPNIETSDSAYFALDQLPPLAEEKNTVKQIAMCFEAYHSTNWQVIFD